MKQVLLSLQNKAHFNPTPLLAIEPTFIHSVYNEIINKSIVCHFRKLGHDRLTYSSH